MDHKDSSYAEAPATPRAKRPEPSTPFSHLANPLAIAAVDHHGPVDSAHGVARRQPRAGEGGRVANLRARSRRNSRSCS
ncbi:hypothetical protein PF008_g19628 [Phytophthora fragariae]|uniref:Uncharacterized protein n=1 Tax=Phytophthora fragariae TaxID=53985 RepID=A0A6G0R2X7_9STRA|nr:hypothetical protein PF008_g19628 [Phytophthora fragariae]